MIAYRRYLLAIVLVSALLDGCGAAYRLQSTYGTKYRYSISMVAPWKAQDLLFRDDSVIIQFRFDEPAIRFQLQNISATDLRIEWAKASLGLRGVYTAVRNLATFYDSSAGASSSPLIPPLGVVRDVVLPRDGVYFDGVQWQVKDLLLTTDERLAARKDSILNSAGATIDLLLPLGFGAVPHTYHFTFVVDSVRTMSWSERRIPSWIPPRPPVRKVRPSLEEQITAAVIAGGFLGVFAYMRTAKKTPIVE